MKQSEAQILDHAAYAATPITQLSSHREFNLTEAYAIQAESVHCRIARGEKLVGYKLGFTSKAKMEQMGIHDIIWGRLTDQMEIFDGGVLERSKFIHPRAEPEIAFRIARRIDREIRLVEVPHYIEGVAAAIEVIDSRYQNFKFSLEDVVADNCSSSAFVLGDWLPANTPVRDLSIALSVNGEEVQSGNSEAILGNPLESLVEISRMMERYGAVLEPGHIVLAGAATSAVHIHQGDKVEAVFTGLGTLGFSVE